MWHWLLSMQNQKPIAFHSFKLCDAERQCSVAEHFFWQPSSLCGTVVTTSQAKRLFRQKARCATVMTSDGMVGQS